MHPMFVKLFIETGAGDLLGHGGRLRVVLRLRARKSRPPGLGRTVVVSAQAWPCCSAWICHRALVILLRR
jgi:hypothetical protein